MKLRPLLPEGDPVRLKDGTLDDRIVRAAVELTKRGLHPVLIGTWPKLAMYFADVEGDVYTIIPPDSSDGIVVQALKLLRERNEYALVAGATMESSEVMRPSLQYLGRDGRVSSCMLFTGEGHDLFCITDPSMIHDSAEELGMAAVQTYQFVTTLRDDPAMAVMGGETRSSGLPKLATGALAAQIVAYVRSKLPQAVVDGPLQYDAARNPLARRQKGLFDSSLGDQPANIAVYLSMDRGNDAYKMLHLETRRPALGPIMLGFMDETGQPYRIADLSRAVEVPDVVELAELLCR